MTKALAGRCLLVAALAGCGPQGGEAPPAIPEDLVAQYAEARCTAMFRCACAPAGWIDVAMCTAQIHAQYDARAEALRATEAAMDAACLADVLAYWRSDAACGDPREAAGVPYCALVRGTGALGEPCASMTTHSFAASSCDDGLYCRDGEICDDPPVAIELALGESCGEGSFACAEGLYCDGATGACATRLGIGGVCDAAAACDADAWCVGFDDENAGVCEARRGEGEACEATSWDPRPCMPEVGETRSYAHYCVDQTCTGAVPAACGPWS